MALIDSLAFTACGQATCLSSARRVASSASYLSSRWLTMDAATPRHQSAVPPYELRFMPDRCGVSGSHLGPKWQLAGVFVSPEARGRGHVIHLIQAVEGACWAAAILWRASIPPMQKARTRVLGDIAWKAYAS